MGDKSSLLAKMVARSDSFQIIKLAIINMHNVCINQAGADQHNMLVWRALSPQLNCTKG